MPCWVTNSGVKNTPFSGSNYEARYLASSFWWSAKLNIRSAPLICGSGGGRFRILSFEVKLVIFDGLMLHFF